MMSKSRFTSVLNGMSSIAKKVYEAVPISDHWTATQIAGELQRLGSSADHRLIAGCINSLISAGIVQEPVKGGFCRTPVKEAATLKAKSINIKSLPKQDNMSTSTPASVNVISLKRTAIDNLGDLAARAVAIADELKGLSHQINNAAIEIQAQVEEGEADMQKLRQFQTLLKSLG